jgi:hypothetical protein
MDIDIHDQAPETKAGIAEPPPPAAAFVTQDEVHRLF